MIGKLEVSVHHVSSQRLKRSIPLPPSFAHDDFIRPQEPNRICFKCKKIPRTPLRPECCNTKLYCEPCSLKVKVCSTHQWENKFVRDDNLYIAVPKLKIKCPNWRDGCDFKDTVNHVYKEHLFECTKSNRGNDSKCNYIIANKSYSMILLPGYLNRN